MIVRKEKRIKTEKKEIPPPPSTWFRSTVCCELALCYEEKGTNKDNY